jgi:hypothetical protein
MPENYHICKIHGNVLINIFAMFSRIICSGLIILLKIIDHDKYFKAMFITMTSLSFISLFLYLFNYQDIRIKAISRIMKSISNDEIKITTEI